jgi:nicotinate-nucleotide--dimethylbenzimidazole phosphoribosyltransferase
MLDPTALDPVTMSSTTFLRLPATALPVDAVLFAMNTLVDPVEPTPDTPARAVPGVRRLVGALARAGLHPHALAVRHKDASRRDRQLRDTADHLVAAGLGPGLLDVVDADAALPGTARARTLVVTRCPEMAAGLTGAGHPVAIVADDPVPEIVFRWLADRLGPYLAASVMVGPLDGEAAEAVTARHLRLTKPPGSLGRLEALGARLSAIAGACPPPVPRPAAAAVFAGDHGVHAQGVSPWPQEVTAQMVANFLSGGAAVNVLAAQAGAEVVVVDVGVATELPGIDATGDVPGADTTSVTAGDGTGAALPNAAGATPRPRLLRRTVRRGTGDLATGPAMSVDDARRALDAGAEVAGLLVEGGARCLVTGDMGIANTTPSASLIASLTERPAAAVTGRGTGIDDALLTRKTALVAAVAARARYQHGDDTLAVLAEVGGLEHAALAGFIVGAAALQVPVVVDGVIAAAALLVASRLVPGVELCVIAGHRSAEPGSAAVLDELGTDPLLDLGLRLGEGTGALLALPLVEASARVLHEMATFDQAGVSDKA